MFPGKLRVNFHDLVPERPLQKDGTGKLRLGEFKVLWTKIDKYLVSLWPRMFLDWLIVSLVTFGCVCQKIYLRRDADDSKTMSSMEMRIAVEEAGKTLLNKSTGTLSLWGFECSDL